MYELELFNLIWLYTTFGVMLAAFIQGTAGFAFALFLTPILLLFLQPQKIIIINIILAFFLNLFTILIMRRNFFSNIVLSRVIPIAVGSLIGMPVGAYILKIIEPGLLKIFIGTIIIIFAILIGFGFTLSFKNYKLSSGIAGLLSGLLMTSTSLGGPPVVIIMHGQRLNKNLIYCNLILYWLFLASCSLLTLAVGKIVEVISIYQVFSFLPSLLIGLYLGIITFNKINVDQFRNPV